MPTTDGYPTDEELKLVKNWDLTKKTVGKFIKYIASIWHWPDWGFVYQKQIGGAWKLELHTGGWSGNESIMESLQKNFIFWTMYWESTRRGGNYYFDTELTKHKWKAWTED